MVPGGDLEFDGRAAMAAEIQRWSINVKLVPGEGIEPTRCHHHRILSPARLPVPPSAHARPHSIFDYWGNRRTCMGAMVGAMGALGSIHSACSAPTSTSI